MKNKDYEKIEREIEVELENLEFALSSPDEYLANMRTEFEELKAKAMEKLRSGEITYQASDFASWSKARK